MSEPPATLRLGLAAGGLRQARRHPLLKSGHRPRRNQQTLHLLRSAGQDAAAKDWLCLASEDGKGDGTTASRIYLPAVPQAAAMADIPTELPGLRQVASGEAVISVLQLDAEPTPVTAQLVSAVWRRGKHETAYEEIVLTAPPGAQARLSAIGAALARDLPVHWSGGTPLLAAAASLGVITPQPLRAGQIPFQIDEDASTGEAFIAGARHCLAQFDANIQPVLCNRDTEGVHQMRVALRRLRSMLGTFKAILPPELVMPLKEELRWLSEPLGAKRDLDVFLAETLAPLRQALELRNSGLPALDHLATVQEDRRAAAQQALESALRAPRCAALRLGFAHLLDSLEETVSASGDAGRLAVLQSPARRFAARLFKKRRKKIKALGARHASLPPSELHQLRIRAKKLRYAAEFFRPFFGRKPMRRFIAALAELQDRLGVLNDADVGANLVRNILDTPREDQAAAALAGWFAGRERLQFDHLGEAWDAFAAIKPFWKDALDD